ncbi:helix-turn-helix transcriptional regulator [Thalassobacillus sp. C254]|uniref:helix-turn-helix domain-containing protein n=1 Tax=Thalassobacillus sp. C254 TaxID=1225341 RepID=UPI0006CF637B|nr:helix-turn-helix transcriptional regulator [Thalassobacillus sp. C254]
MLVSKIGECIKRSGYRRDYIAKEMGIQKQQLSNWCTGRSKPRTEDLFKLAALLNCKTDDMYEFIKEEK